MWSKSVPKFRIFDLLKITRGVEKCRELTLYDRTSFMHYITLHYIRKLFIVA